MNQETKQCQNCKLDFRITSDDFSFYEKIKVPSPTWCPECRMVRRMLMFNERALFKGICDLCGKSGISSHRPESLHPVYCEPCWWSDKWDAMEYGRDYDFSRTFFNQFKDLRDSVPLPILNNIHSSNINSEYVNMCSYVKNCYLCFNSDYDENCSYSCYLEQSKQCLDVDHALQVEFCYDSIGLYKSYRVKYSVDIIESMDIFFSRDLKNCSNCFGCINLRNKQYCIFNEQKTKEEYFEEIKKYDLSNLSVVNELKKKTEEFFYTQPRRNITGIGNKNVSGDYIFWSKNVRNSYDAVGAEDLKYCQFFIIEGAKNCMDVTMWGSTLVESYECCGVGHMQNNLKFCYESWNQALNLNYCGRIMTSNSDLFGCIGLKNKQYCILNKQYSKEDYEDTVEKIKIQMTKDKEWGEFFPPSMSLFGYNESFANKYRPLSKEEIIKMGYKYSEPEKRDHNIGVDVIECEHKQTCTQQCTGAFKLTQSENEFYKKEGIATPELCPNCRHYERLKLRNPIGLYLRKCSKCDKSIETSYNPESPEIVYCELCYQKEVI